MSEPTSDARKRHTEKETDMPSPIERHHEELVDLLTTLAFDVSRIADHLTEPEDVKDEPTQADEPVRAPDPCADVTAEPPVGSQVTDRFGNVRQFRDGKWLVWGGYSWLEMNGDLEDFRSTWGPFRPTTDADRKREGLSVDTAPEADPDEALVEDADERNPLSEVELKKVYVSQPARLVAHGLWVSDSTPHWEIADMPKAVFTDLQERAAKLEAERDAARDDLRRADGPKWRARYEALRADVEAKWSVPGNPHHGVLWTREEILRRDDEWGRDE